MVREQLRDDQWERIKDLLPGKASDCGVTTKDNRKFLEAVLWIARTGSPVTAFLSMIETDCDMASDPGAPC